MKWIRLPKQIRSDGTEVIRYSNDEAPIYIESQKRQIPHANGKSGTWAHTTYAVLMHGIEITTKSTLAAAKECAEDIANK